MLLIIDLMFINKLLNSSHKLKTINQTKITKLFMSKKFANSINDFLKYFVHLQCILIIAIKKSSVYFSINGSKS